MVVPGMPCHITQRGILREDVFFCDGERNAYLKLLLDYSRNHGPGCIRFRPRQHRQNPTTDPTCVSKAALIFLPNFFIRGTILWATCANANPKDIVSWRHRTIPLQALCLKKTISVQRMPMLPRFRD